MNYRIVLAAALAACLSAGAAPLTPQQALQAAMAKGQSGMMGAPARQLEHVYTMDAEQHPAVYVFAAPEEQPGFLITAADDAWPRLVLGYSDAETFDPANIPPALSEWLEALGHQILAAPSLPQKAAGRTLAPAKEERQSVSPLCATKWNQGDPYNQSCPVVNNGRSVTGCVATAAAQVMKKHNYPTTGQGSHSYEWSVNYRTYSTSANFGATTYDWANMLNTYSSNATTAQKQAVATLMSHCGVACDMNYTPNESGAVSSIMAQGMIDYFKYDKGMRYFSRDWFTLAQWTDLIYAEVAAGRPVLYSGRTSADEGHAFVCDGYSQNDYFHINWGWGGSCDGYYTLYQLDPADQGIGGAASGYAFNYDQQAAVGIRPDAGTANLVPLMYADNGLVCQSSSVSRNSTVVLSGGYWSGTLGTAVISMGLKLVSSSDVKYITYATYQLGQFYGINQFEISGSSFPEGEYDVYPAFKTDYTDWQEMYYPIDKNGHLHFKVTSSTITITEPEDPEEDSFTANLVSITPTENADDPTIYLGKTYDFKFSMTSTETGNINLLAGIYAGSTLYTYSSIKNVSVNANSPVEDSWTIAIPETMEPGNYKVTLLYYASDEGVYYLVGNSTDIKVMEDPVEIVVSAAIGDAPDEVTIGTDVSFPFIITSTGATHIKLQAKVYDKDGNLAASSLSSTTTFDQAGTIEKNFLLTFSESKFTDGTYNIRLAEIEGTMTVASYLTEPYEFNVVSPVMPEPVVTITSLDFPTSEYEMPAYQMPEEMQKIMMAVHCEGAEVSTSVVLEFFDYQTNEKISETASKNVHIEPGHTTYISFVGPYPALEFNTIYGVRGIAMDGEVVSDLYAFQIIPTDGIATVDADQADAKFYTLQGIAVERPIPGIYIMLKDGRPTKVLVK